MTSATGNLPLHQNQNQADDQIDLIQLVETLCRRWPWIACGGVLGLVLSGMQLLTSKPVYQGEFQIVLGQDNSKSGASALLAQNPGLAAIAGFGGNNSNDSIATEIQILNSSSVLKPVFDAVKARKPESVANTMRFQDWAKSAITVEQEDSTSVLNVKFRDTNKKLVLPITRMIAQAYKNYPSRGRARELDNVITYLEKQLAIIKPQAAQSSRKALDWLLNGLGLLDGLPLAGNVAGAGISQEDRLEPDCRHRWKHRNCPHYCQPE